MNEWTVRFDRSVDVDHWAEEHPFDVVEGLHSWVAWCVEAGPPIDAWLTELEQG